MPWLVTLTSCASVALATPVQAAKYAAMKVMDFMSFPPLSRLLCARRAALGPAGVSDQFVKSRFSTTHRPFLTCCSRKALAERWLVLENLPGGELKMSLNTSPDSSAARSLAPVRSLPARLA